MPPEPPPGYQPKGSKRRADDVSDDVSNGVAGGGSGGNGGGNGGGSSSGAGAATSAGYAARPAGYGARPSLKLPKPPPVGLYPLRLADAGIGWPARTPPALRSAGAAAAAAGAGPEGGEDVSGRGSAGAAGGSAVAAAAPLLSGVSLAVARGMRLVVRGPNGAGKSTLVKALAGKVGEPRNHSRPASHRTPYLPRTVPSTHH
jgi:ABC-type multidrug transport system fused ATPase/permease subunit